MAFYTCWRGSLCGPDTSMLYRVSCHTSPLSLQDEIIQYVMHTSQCKTSAQTYHSISSSSSSSSLSKPVVNATLPLPHKKTESKDKLSWGLWRNTDKTLKQASWSISFHRAQQQRWRSVQRHLGLPFQESACLCSGADATKSCLCVPSQ